MRKLPRERRPATRFVTLVTSGYIYPATTHALHEIVFRLHARFSCCQCYQTQAAREEPPPRLGRKALHGTGTGSWERARSILRALEKLALMVGATPRAFVQLASVLPVTCETSKHRARWAATAYKNTKDSMSLVGERCM